MGRRWWVDSVEGDSLERREYRGDNSSVLGQGGWMRSTGHIRGDTVPYVGTDCSTTNEFDWVKFWEDVSFDECTDW